MIWSSYLLLLYFFYWIEFFPCHVQKPSVLVCVYSFFLSILSVPFCWIHCCLRKWGYSETYGKHSSFELTIESFLSRQWPMLKCHLYIKLQFLFASLVLSWCILLVLVSLETDYLSMLILVPFKLCVYKAPAVHVGKKRLSRELSYWLILCWLWLLLTISAKWVVNFYLLGERKLKSNNLPWRCI